MFETESKNIALATVFGVVIFVLKAFLPFPLDKFLIAFQVTLLAFGSLLIGSLGATYVSLIGGTLTALWRPLTALTILMFSLVYGVLIDGFTLLLRVKDSKGGIRLYRVIVSLTVSSVIIGLVSYYTSALLLKIVPYDPIVGLATLLAGLVNGVVAGCLVTLVWKKLAVRETGRETKRAGS